MRTGPGGCVCVSTHGEHCAYQHHDQIDDYLSVADHALSPFNRVAIFCVYIAPREHARIWGDSRPIRSDIRHSLVKFRFARQVSFSPHRSRISSNLRSVLVYVRPALFSIYRLFLPVSILLYTRYLFIPSTKLHRSLARRLRRVILIDRNSHCFVVERNRKLDGMHSIRMVNIFFTTHTILVFECEITSWSMIQIF